MKLYLVDVCGTLFFENTTTGGIQYFFKKKSKCFVFRIAMQITLFFCIIILNIIEKVLKFNTIKYFIFISMRKVKVIDFEKSSKEYAAFLMDKKKISCIWNILENKNEKDIIILSSASIEPVVSAISAVAGFSYYVASELEQKDGFYTGRYLKNITGCKEDALIKKYGIKMLQSMSWYVISDNISDRLLIEKAENVYIVLHKKHHINRWKGIKAVFVKIS